MLVTILKKTTKFHSYNGTPFERPTPLDNGNLNILVLISTPDKWSLLFKGHFDFADAKGVASQEGFHCIPVSIHL